MTHANTLELKVRPVDYDRAKAVTAAVAKTDATEFDTAIEAILDDAELTPYDSARAVIGILAAALTDPTWNVTITGENPTHQND